MRDILPGRWNRHVVYAVGDDLRVEINSELKPHVFLGEDLVGQVDVQ